MQCPSCHRLRHGECEPVYEDELNTAEGQNQEDEANERTRQD
jgi:hypothetical protein